jgi:hypothetical protein
VEGVPTNDEPQTGKEYTSDQEVRWCPGCGDYAVLKAADLAEAIGGLVAEAEGVQVDLTADLTVASEEIVS